MLQAILNTAADPRLYNPNRDVAHNALEVLQEVRKRLAADKWPAMAEILARAQVTPQHAERGLQALSSFLTGSLEVPKETMYQGLVRAGWFEVPEAVNIAVLAHLGAILLGMQWGGIREATLRGVGPLSNCASVVDYGRRFAGLALTDLARLPWWRRWCRLSWAWLRGVGRALAGQA
jgi:hypothetical protein